jgi:hypothetical protein
MGWTTVAGFGVGHLERHQYGRARIMAKIDGRWPTKQEKGEE